MSGPELTWRRALGAGSVAIALLAAACTASGEGGRAVTITQGDEGCTPARIEATPGEKLKLVVKNESDRDYEVEGIDGMKLEEVVVPKGRTREPGYKVPTEPGTHKIKCYVPGGPNTIIEVVAGSGAAPTDDEESGSAETPESRPSDATVNVELIDWAVKPDVPTVAAGAIKFVATNASADQVHELAVLKKADGDAFEPLGEIEDIPVGVTAEIVLDLEAGEYTLACLIVPGEAGSTEDHFKKGMTTDFTVTD